MMDFLFYVIISIPIFLSLYLFPTVIVDVNQVENIFQNSVFSNTTHFCKFIGLSIFCYLVCR